HPPAPRPARLPALRDRRAGRDRGGSNVRHLQALLRLRPRQRAAGPPLRRRPHVSRSALGRARRRGAQRDRVPAAPVLLGGDVLFADAARRSDASNPQPGTSVRGGRHTAVDGRARGLSTDADGFYHHQGRADDVFKAAGQWVTPADVERVLLAHPAVAEAAVVGAAESGGLVKPFAFVVARNGARGERLADELTALAAERLPPHQRARRIAPVE